jgi:DNA-directed RNA polymerase subunit beta'
MDKKVLSLFNQSQQAQDFDFIKISLASPEKVKSWSFGEVKKPETINYRTFKPERDGLFCARIFGPIKDYECLCGKYKRIKYRGIVCEKCGVEVTTAKVRRERMGHIDLASPIVHIWFLKILPSKIGTLLDIQVKRLEKVLYFESYIVTEPGLTPFEAGQILSEEDYYNAKEEYGDDSFTALIGAEAIKELLKKVNLVEEKELLKSELKSTNSELKRKKIIKRLKIINSFIDSGNKPEHMVLDVLPVIPPELRPLVPLDGGRFATSDLNDLYRRVINRNNRLRRLITLNAPDIIIRNEKRMLQESVDALFDNGRRGRVIKDANKRPFKSLSDMLKGKQGRFRQNLLGKRVDYSGRSVVTVGPELKLHQCGLPKEMALELFKPFIYGKLEMYGFANTIKVAKKMVETKRPEVWDILDEVIMEHPVLLNRAPTLHRLGIQAFEPLLIEGKAIRLHPLVCSAFNADFDGDQMAVHVPLSLESQIEARTLMMSTNNILSPASGKPVIVPSQDIVLGLYYLSLIFDGEKGEGMVFGKIGEIEHAIESKSVTLHSKIKYRYYDTDSEGREIVEIVDTTPGRALISELLPKGFNVKFETINKILTKKEISNVLEKIYTICGPKNTVIFADKSMALGFKHACKAGISFGKDDIIVPESKQKHISETLKEVEKFEKQYSEGLITRKEKYNKVVDSWSHCTDRVTNDMMRYMKGEVQVGEKKKGQLGVNSIYMMADSGARGSVTQIKQLAAMRGLMAKPSGEIIETPIISNFKEGLNVLEYFNSSHGARKGLADTALKTANSGYLTRRLVDVAQDAFITNDDCGTKNGILVRSEFDGADLIESLAQKIEGRCTVADITNPENNKVIVKSGEMITHKHIRDIELANIEEVKIRSVTTCENDFGICVKCYGKDLSSGYIVNVGEAVGIIAAQSIGEPGTQLTMRTFHIGGAATGSKEKSAVEASHNGNLEIVNGNLLKNKEGRFVVISRNCEVKVVDKKGRELSKSKVPFGANILVADGATVKASQQIAEWDPYTIPVITEKSGKVVYKDLIEGLSVSKKINEQTGLVSTVVIDWKQNKKKLDLKPRITLKDKKGEAVVSDNKLEARYFLPAGSVLIVDEDQSVEAGDILARIPKESSKNKDITGGLPRVADLFEARKPKDVAILADFDGVIEFGKDFKNKTRLVLKPKKEGVEPVEYVIPKGKTVIVNEGDFVSKGDILMEGNPAPHDILRILGVEALTHYLTSEVQAVYRLQGVSLNNKHIEIIIRQMLKKVEITEPGETTFLQGEQVDRDDLVKENHRAIKENMKPANASPVLQGITKASLQTKSFISSASFQETTRVLSEAALAGAEDYLTGLKENVIVGRLIPVGTGAYLRKVKKEAKLRDESILARQQKELEEEEREINKVEKQVA